MGGIQEKTWIDLCLRKSCIFPEDSSNSEVQITFKMSTLQVATQEKNKTKHTKKLAAARKKDILHRMSKSRVKTTFLILKVRNEVSMLDLELKNCSIQQSYMGSQLNMQVGACFQKD